MPPKPPRLVPPPKEETTNPGTPLSKLVRYEFERFEQRIPVIVAEAMSEVEGRIAAAVVNKLSGRLVEFENRQRDLEISKGELRNEQRRHGRRIEALEREVEALRRLTRITDPAPPPDGAE